MNKVKELFSFIKDEKSIKFGTYSKLRNRCFEILHRDTRIEKLLQKIKKDIDSMEYLKGEEYFNEISELLEELKYE